MNANIKTWQERQQELRGVTLCDPMGTIEESMVEEITELRAALSNKPAIPPGYALVPIEQKPVAYFRAEADGTLLWGEDCVSSDDSYPSCDDDVDSDGNPVISLPLYTAPQTPAYEKLREVLAGALAVIDDYLAYDHNGDPWTEDARTMGEMDIDDYKHDGRRDAAHAALAAMSAPKATP